MILQINTMMCGELASPGVRYSRVQQNTSGLPNVSTSMRGDPPFIHFYHTIPYHTSQLFSHGTSGNINRAMEPDA